MTRASADGKRASPFWPALVALAAVVVYTTALRLFRVEVG